MRAQSGIKQSEGLEERLCKWHSRDYQAPVLMRAGLIEAARKRNWERLPEMLDAISERAREEVFANSLIRLLRTCDDRRIEPVLLAALKDPSPLIRSSAAESLGMRPSTAAVQPLVAATADDYRLVRIRAAQSIAGIQGMRLAEPHASTVKKATDEYLASMMARPDQWSSHYCAPRWVDSEIDYVLKQILKKMVARNQARPDDCVF
jgi:HEAT repeat protein